MLYCSGDGVCPPHAIIKVSLPLASVSAWQCYTDRERSSHQSLPSRLVLHTSPCLQHTHIHSHTHAAHTDTHTSTHTRMQHTQTHTHIHSHTHAAEANRHKHTSTHIHTNTHTHTSMHTHTHTEAAHTRWAMVCTCCLSPSIYITSTT